MPRIRRHCYFFGFPEGGKCLRRGRVAGKQKHCCPGPSGFLRLRNVISRLSDPQASPAPRNALELRPQLAFFTTDASGVVHGGFCLRICIANTELNRASHDRNATLTQPRTALLDTRRPQARWLDAVRSNRRRCAQRAVWWRPSSHSAPPGILGRPRVSWDPADLEIDPQRYRFSMSPYDFENQTGKIPTRHEARLEHDQRHCPARISIQCTMVPSVILQSAVLRN